jgi:WD40 repeat protein
VTEYNYTTAELRRVADAEIVTLAGTPSGFTFSPDGRHFVVTSADGTPAQLHRSADAAVIAQLAGSTYTHNVFFSPDGRHFVVIYDTTTVELRRVADGSVIAQLAKSVYTVSFSQNSDYFVITPLGGTPDDLRRTADASVVPFAKPVQSVLFSSYSTPMVHYDVGSSELAMVQYDNGSSELWNMEDRPYSLVNLGIAVSNLAIPLTAQKIVVRYQIGDVYLLDAKWLTAMHGVFAAPSGADLIRLACEGRLKSEYWTQEDQEALESALNGQEPLACK